MIISLIERALVDKAGPKLRLMEDQKQLELTEEEILSDWAPIGFIDHGVVSWCGVEYYMSSITRPLKENDND